MPRGQRSPAVNDESTFCLQCWRVYVCISAAGFLASEPARPALHHRVALALAAAVDRSRTAELGDELKKPLQALREAGRAKPRWILAATSFRLQHVSPISRSDVSQLVALCLSFPVPARN